MGVGRSSLESLVLNSSFWKKKRVFLTGHTGFKGSWLSLWLQHLGTNLMGYSLGPPTSPNLYQLAKVGEEMHSVTGDILDKKTLASAIEDFEPEIVIHMAAQPLVLESYKDPTFTFATNIIGTSNLLEACRFSQSVKSIVNVTTDKCYENKEWLWGYREHDPLGGYDPYSASKACSEIVSNAFRCSFFSANSDGPALATARAGNVIGGGDWAKDRLLPDLIRAISNGEPVKIRNASAVRPWQHVLEPLHGYLMLTERLYSDGSPFAEAWNFGPKDEDTPSVSWIIDELLKYWPQSQSTRETADHPHEAQTLKLDTSKTRSRLGWKPLLDIEQAIFLTADWHINVGKGNDPKAETLRQILSFSDHLK